MKKLTIEGRLDGLNEYTNACRSGWGAGSRMKIKNERKICNAIRKQMHGVKFGRIRPFFVWYEEDNRRDADNVAFAKKFILDALKKEEVIVDDSRKYVEGFTDVILVDKNHPRIEVYIKEEG